jgi:16S rRNA (guanine527-N7)-methyltransferase
LLDVGSGAGLPGLVLAVALPEVAVTCVDSGARKIGFVRHAAADLGLSLSVVHARVEEMDGAFDVVVSRAFASLRKFVEASRERLAVNGTWLAMKGRIPENELRDLPAWVEAFHVEQLHVPNLDAQRCLIWMSPRVI